ncbi:unnamed protein product [Urochloa humidicola]
MVASSPSWKLRLVAVPRALPLFPKLHPFVNYHNASQLPENLNFVGCLMAMLCNASEPIYFVPNGWPMHITVLCQSYLR